MPPKELMVVIALSAFEKTELQCMKRALQTDDATLFSRVVSLRSAQGTFFRVLFEYALTSELRPRLLWYVEEALEILENKES